MGTLILHYRFPIVHNRRGNVDHLELVAPNASIVENKYHDWEEVKVEALIHCRRHLKQEPLTLIDGLAVLPLHFGVDDNWLPFVLLDYAVQCWLINLCHEEVVNF